MKLKDFQLKMSEYILNNKNSDELKKDILQHSLEVYKKNYLYTMIEAFQKSYPVVFKFLEENNFKYFVKLFLESHISYKKNLDEFGFEFIDFLKQRPELNLQPHIPYLALLDWYWNNPQLVNEIYSLPEGLFEFWRHYNKSDDAQEFEINFEKQENVHIITTNEGTQISLT